MQNQQQYKIKVVGSIKRGGPNAPELPEFDATFNHSTKPMALKRLIESHNASIIRNSAIGANADTKLIPYQTTLNFNGKQPIMQSVGPIDRTSDLIA